MHDAVPQSEVLWYDAVTASGELKWQNTLNANNICFFEPCDGIFTNYHWKETTPQEAATTASKVMSIFLKVLHDVFH